MPIIKGDPGDTKYVASNIPFMNLDHLTDRTYICAKFNLYVAIRLNLRNRIIAKLDVIFVVARLIVHEVIYIYYPVDKEGKLGFDQAAAAIILL